MGAKRQNRRRGAWASLRKRLTRWVVVTGLIAGVGLVAFWGLAARLGFPAAVVIGLIAAAIGIAVAARVRAGSGVAGSERGPAIDRGTGRRGTGVGRIASAVLRGHSRPRFFGPGERVRLALGTCHAPLVYVCKGRAQEAFDPSLIERGLKVKATDAARVPALPGWPSYREATPGQRAVYQRWLVDGRRDPRTPIGYVFLFFYGLERRALIEGRDLAAIAEEVLRLLELYGEASHAFRRYATNLLWHTIRRGAARGEMPGGLLEAATGSLGRRDEEALLLCLSVLYELERPVPGALALRLAEHDPRTTNSVVVRRHRAMFEHLFLRRYRKQFGEGMTLRAGKRPRRVAYDPASGLLGRKAGARLEVEVPDCLRISSQFKPLVAIWESCIEELRGYDRAARRSEGETLTAEMYEQLPEELRTKDHPELNTWWRIKEEHADEDGWSVVPISALAEAKGIEPRRKLTVAQSRRLLSSADAMGLALEPDSRVTGRAYRWDEPVCLFTAERDERPSGRYLAAATLLRLGMVVAEADGEVDATELDQITRHLEQQLDLSDAESERLEQLERLLIREGARAELLTKGVIESLSRPHRAAVGGYLVGVAAADGVITVHERKALEKLYRRLSLNAEELEKLIADAEPADEPTAGATDGELDESEPAHEGDENEGEHIPAPRGFTLDRDRLREVRQQTDEVARILTEAMAGAEADEANSDASSPPSGMQPEGETGDEAEAETTDRADGGGPTARASQVERSSPGPTRLRPGPDASVDVDAADPTQPDEGDEEEGLAARLRPFVDAIAERAEWPGDELRALADRHGLMLRGAIDEVNEWAEVRFGDRIIEEDGATYRVDTELMERP